MWKKTLLNKKSFFIEVINHAKNRYSFGRILTLYKESEDFDSIEISIQDNGRTMKIFIDSNQENPEK
jgi:hypothetical protein